MGYQVCVFIELEWSEFAGGTEAFISSEMPWYAEIAIGMNESLPDSSTGLYTVLYLSHLYIFLSPHITLRWKLHKRYI